MNKISLIVCTRNRSQQLERCLRAVSELQYDRRWELVIVDNGSSDRTKEVAEQFIAPSLADVRVVHEPKPGLGRARNTGIAHSSGEVIVFTDDDCYPAVDFLTQWRTVFQSKSIAFGGGRIELYDLDDLPITIKTSKERKDIPPESFIEPGMINGANMGFRREPLIAVGAFDDRLGAGTPYACEDVDVQLRLSTAGYNGIYDPNPLVYHHHGRKTQSDRKHLMSSYVAGHGAYYAKCLLNTKSRRLHKREIARRIYHSKGRGRWLLYRSMLRFGLASVFRV